MPVNTNRFEFQQESGLRSIRVDHTPGIITMTDANTTIGYCRYDESGEIEYVFVSASHRRKAMPSRCRQVSMIQSLTSSWSRVPCSHEAAYPAAIRALALAATLTFMPSAHAGPPLLDFSRPEVVREFRIVNDAVMGGVSTSKLSQTGAGVRFEGEVSLENNGGFASFRGPVRFPVESAGLLATVRGDGQRYKLILKLDDSTSTAQYQTVFVAPREWQTLRFVPPDFAAVFRGRAVAAPVVRLVDVQYFGALISDKQSGAFRLELRDVRAD